MTMRFLGRLRLALGFRARDDDRPDAGELQREVMRLYGDGRYQDAAAIARRSLELQRQRLGELHPDYATALNNLAMLLQKGGDLDGAEPLLRRALEVRRQVAGEHDPAFATALNNLALVLLDRGDLDGAEPLLRQALEVRREALGDRDPDYASSLSSLAALRQRRGNPSEAEPLLRQVLEIRREAAGGLDPAYATALDNLALVLLDRGDLDGAEPLLRQALEVRRVSLGESHPDLVSSLDNLAALRGRRNGLPTDEPPPVPRAEMPTAPESVASIEIGPSNGRPPSTGEAAGRQGGPPPDARALLGELALLAGVFADVGRQLAIAATRMQDAGLPPAKDLLAREAACRREFVRLRTLTLRLAEERATAFTVQGDAAGVRDLVALLERVSEAEAERDRFTEDRRKALAILDRVARIAHLGRSDLAALSECQAAARAMADSIAASPPGANPPDVGKVIRGEHPYSDLLTIVEGREGLRDAEWASLYEKVLKSFGRPLAVAASRGSLVVTPGETGGRRQEAGGTPSD